MPSGGISALLHRTRQEFLAARMKTPISFPDTLMAQVYRVHDGFQFPEQAFARYQPQNHPIGVCFSGGGPRSMSASMGQMQVFIMYNLLCKFI